MSLRIIKSGFMTLVQDYGRYGFRHLGVAHSGPMDEHAFLWANHLLGNSYNAVQLEIHYGGFCAEFTQDTMIAISGADLKATLNDQAIFPWQSYIVKAGDIIYFRTPISGLRSYLAVQDGFTVETQLSSVATTMREQLGGLHQNGDKLAEGECIGYAPYSTTKQTRQVPHQFVPQYSSRIELRFIPNRSVTSAGDSALTQFSQQTYRVSQQIDRMGYRLSGTAIETSLTGIISQGLSPGAIQLPQDGQPIVLMKDQQTMGGYPLLGCVLKRDIAQLAQSKPGVDVTFKQTDIETAQKELLSYKRFFNVPL